jgi:hypothetical protein
VNLSDHDDDTDGIIDKGDGYLHPYVPLDSNDMESLKNDYTPIKKYKDNMNPTESFVFCSAIGTLSISSHGELVKDLLFFIN